MNQEKFGSNKPEVPKLKLRQQNQNTETTPQNQEGMAQEIDSIITSIKNSIDLETPQVFENKLRSVAKILTPEQLQEFKQTLKNTHKNLVDQSRGDAVQKSAVLVRFYTRKHIERPGSVKDQEYKANELAELKDRLASLKENTFYHGEALRYSSIKKFCKLIYGISSKENPRSIADKRKFYISDVIIDQLRQTEYEGNFEQYKQLDGIRKKEGLSNDQRCVYEYLEREIRAFKNEKGKDSENYIKNLPATAVESERFKDILLSLVVPANSIGDTEDKIDVLNVHFDPSDLESVSTLNNEYARQKLQRVQVILDQALTLFNMKNATRDLNSTNYRKYADAEIAPNTVFEVVNEELGAKTKELKKIHSQLIAQIGSFKNDIFSTDYRVFLKEPELVTQKIKQIDKFAPATEMSLKDKVALKQQQNLQSIYDLLAQEEVIQAEVAKILYDFLAEENLDLTYSGVQVKSSVKGLEEHVAKSRSGVIVRDQDLTDASLVRDLDGELPELINSKLLLLEECYANLLYSTQDRQSLNLSTRNNRHTDSQDNKPKIRKRQAPVLRDAVAEQNSIETTISKVEQIKEASTNKELEKNSDLKYVVREGLDTPQPVINEPENTATTKESLHSQTEASIPNSTNQNPSPTQEALSSKTQGLTQGGIVTTHSLEISTGKTKTEVNSFKTVEPISEDPRIKSIDGKSLDFPAPGVKKPIEGESILERPEVNPLAQFDSVISYREGISIAKKGEAYFFVNASGNRIGKVYDKITTLNPIYDVTIASLNGRKFLINSDGTKTTTTGFDDIIGVGHKLIKGNINGKWVVVNTSSRKNSRMFDDIGKFKDGVAVAEAGNKQFLINENGEIIEESVLIRESTEFKTEQEQSTSKPVSRDLGSGLSDHKTINNVITTDSSKNKSEKGKRLVLGKDLNDAAKKLNMDPLDLFMFKLMFGDISTVFPKDLIDKRNLDIIRMNIDYYESLIEEYLDSHCSPAELRILKNKRYYYNSGDIKNEGLMGKSLKAREYARDKIKQPSKKTKGGKKGLFGRLFG